MPCHSGAAQVRKVPKTQEDTDSPAWWEDEDEDESSVYAPCTNPPAEYRRVPPSPQQCGQPLLHSFTAAERPQPQPSQSHFRTGSRARYSLSLLSTYRHSVLSTHSTTRAPRAEAVLTVPVAP